MKKLRNVVIAMFSVEILVMIYWMFKAGCSMPPVPVTGTQMMLAEAAIAIDSNAAPDLQVLGNDSLGLYNGWCDNYPCELNGGLRAGDWAIYRDSSRYACTLTNLAKVPKGGDSSKYAYIDSAGYHPGLVTVAVFYKGKRYDNYVSKSSYDFGNTNCLWTSTCRTTWTHPFMGISVGGADRYDPNLYTAPFESGDKIVVVIWVNKDRRIKEQNYDNNIGILPWRRNVGVESGWSLDWSAMTKQNVAAINRWIRKV